MEKDIFVLEIWCHAYDNGIRHHEVHLFNSYARALEFINKEAASQYGMEIPQYMSPHIGYGRKKIDGVDKCPRWYVNGHWRNGGVFLFPVRISEEIIKGSIDYVEIYPMEVDAKC